MRYATRLKRVLVTACSSEHPRFTRLFQHASLDDWEPIFVADIDQSKFFLQHTGVDVWLVNDNVVKEIDMAGRDLDFDINVPVTFLCESDADAIMMSFQFGAEDYLPRWLVWNHPPLLAAGLKQAFKIGERQRSLKGTNQQWHRCRRRVDRLLQLIWQTTPAETPFDWFPQRFALERLQQEIARANRFQEPLTIAIGEVAPEKRRGESSIDRLPQIIGRAKRRCDVVGQYGPDGMLLVLVQTAKQGAIKCCERLRAILNHDDACFGIAEADGETTLQQLLRRAEENLEAAKREKHEPIVAV